MRRKHKPVVEPAKPPDGLRLATLAEACAYTKYSRTTLWRLISAKKIKAYRLPNRTLVDLDTVDGFLKNADGRTTQVA